MTLEETQGRIEPDAALRSLDRLVGTWELSGETSGRITYEWMEGRFFMIQHVEIEHAGNRTQGIEVIGRLKPFGAKEPGEDVVSRFYDDQGNTFDYVYELEGDTLTIWGGERGSPAYYRGTFGDDDRTLAGEWVYPGGGYSTIATRIG